MFAIPRCLWYGLGLLGKWHKAEINCQGKIQLPNCMTGKNHPSPPSILPLGRLFPSTPVQIFKWPNCHTFALKWSFFNDTAVCFVFLDHAKSLQYLFLCDNSELLSCLQKVVLYSLGTFLKSWKLLPLKKFLPGTSVKSVKALWKLKTQNKIKLSEPWQMT